MSSNTDGRHLDSRMPGYDPPTPLSAALLRIGPLELAVLTTLWKAEQPMTVRAIHEQMSYPEWLAYTTVATVLNNLWAKQHVIRSKQRHRWYYWAARSRDEYLAVCIAALLAEASDKAAVLALAADLPAQAYAPPDQNEPAAMASHDQLVPQRAMRDSPDQRQCPSRAAGEPS